MIFFFLYYIPAYFCCCWVGWMRDRRIGKEGLKKCHMFAVTLGPGGKVLNKKYFFQWCLHCLELWEHWSCWGWRSDCAVLHTDIYSMVSFPGSAIKTNDLCENPQPCDYPSPPWIICLHPMLPALQLRGSFFPYSLLISASFSICLLTIMCHQQDTHSG